jgi:DNA-binding PadR family transcriptional regulator
MRLSELENAVLGVVWRRGPCSTYVVKRVFENSPSVSWSASAGSIYPLVKKLCAHGLLSVQERAWGTQVKTLVSITEAGRDALRSWIATVPNDIGRPSADPIRTRAFFLDAVSKEQRLSFLDEAEKATDAALREVESAMAALPCNESEFELLGASGAVFQLKARLRWIRYLRRELGVTSKASEA